MSKKVITDPDWAAEVEDVEPLSKDDVYRVHNDAYEVESFDDLNDFEYDEAKPIFHRNNELNNISIVDIAENNEPFTIKEKTANLFVGSRLSISNSVLQNLKKCIPSYSLKLDLHGFKEEEAWNVLLDFLLKAYSLSVRNVLIIHGKGKGYGDNLDMGIIKSNICAWLESSPVVLAYHTAQAKHGGSGAVYVLIKKNK